MPSFSACHMENNLVNSFATRLCPKPDSPMKMSACLHHRPRIGESTHIKNHLLTCHIARCLNDCLRAAAVDFPRSRHERSTSAFRQP
eukprot:9451606-Pyramimonas_sp.AAC.1